MRSKAVLFLMGVVIATFGTPPAAVAQTPATQETLDEVLVTARKRDEALIDVPVAVDHFTREEIESAGILRPQDYIGLTPNMTMVQTQNQGTSFIVVRGISQARNSEPSVAVLIDGVLMANPSQFNQELLLRIRFSHADRIGIEVSACSTVHHAHQVRHVVFLVINDP